MDLKDLHKQLRKTRALPSTIDMCKRILRSLTGGAKSRRDLIYWTHADPVVVRRAVTLLQRHGLIRVEGKTKGCTYILNG